MCLSIDELLDIKSQGFLTREISRQLEPQERTFDTGTNSYRYVLYFQTNNSFNKEIF